MKYLDPDFGTYNVGDRVHMFAFKQNATVTKVIDSIRKGFYVLLDKDKVHVFMSSDHNPEEIAKVGKSVREASKVGRKNRRK